MLVAYEADASMPTSRSGPDGDADHGYALLGLTAFVAPAGRRRHPRAAAVRRGGARSRRHLARRRRRHDRCSPRRCRTAVRLKAQEQAMSARARGVRAAERSDRREPDRRSAGRRSRTARVEILNPAGRRMLGLAGAADLGADYRTLLAVAPPLVRGDRRMPRRPRSRSCAGRCRCRGRRGRRTSASPCRRSVGAGAHARRHLPVLRPDDRARTGRAAAAEGDAGAARRVDRRHRPRVPQRPGDDSRLRPADRSAGAAAQLPAVRRGHPPGNRTARPGRHQLPQLRQARTGRLPPVDLGGVAQRAIDDLRHELPGRRHARRRRRVRPASTATTCCCGRCSPTWCATRSRPRGGRRRAGGDVHG